MNHETPTKIELEQELEILRLANKSLGDKVAKLGAALNKIAILNRSDLAGTFEFEDRIMEIVEEALNIKKKWPY